MASSTIGLIDMPYKQLPFYLDGSDLNLQVLQQHASDHPLIVISGARTANDVMRGEETKILGSALYLTDPGQESQLLMPGTHPKHILIKNHQVQNFKSYMTGEFFDLLSTHSVLSASVQEGGNINDPVCRESFIEGVKSALDANILHAAFMVRTRQVLHQVPALQNYHYLSGLLIGCELKEINPDLPVYLVSAALHTSLYSIACAALGIPIAMNIDADEALIRGQQAVLRRIAQDNITAQDS
jgi:2-dehydro-3-deoxygalactonokinase